MKQVLRFEIFLMIFLTLSSYQAFHVEEMDQECSSYWVKQFSGCFNDTEEIGHWKFCIQRESCVISSPLAFYNDTVFESRIQHCERSELRLHFEAIKSYQKCPKWSILASF